MDKLIGIFYEQHVDEYIKHCNDFDFGFKCWANQILNSSLLNCSNRCIPMILDPITSVVEHNRPFCPTTKKDYCLTQDMLEGKALENVSLKDRVLKI